MSTIKAICKADYDRLKKAKEYLNTNPSFKKTVYLDRIEDRQLPPEDIKGLEYFEAYGVWFDQKLSAALQEAASCNSRIAFLDRKHEKIEAGVHPAVVAGKECWLYFWRAQGFPRGVIVLADDEDANLRMAEISEQAPWNWEEMLLV